MYVYRSGETVCCRAYFLVNNFVHHGKKLCTTFLMQMSKQIFMQTCTHSKCMDASLKLMMELLFLTLAT